MEIEFSPRALADLEAWKLSGNQKAQEKISGILASVFATPFAGIGKPEPLKHRLSGLWSRRITRSDRLVYEVAENLITIHSLKGHY